MAKGRGGKATRVKRDLRSQFFEVRILAEPQMATILEEVMALPSDDRAEDIRGHDVRMQRKREVDGLIEGDLMTVVYHGDVPVKANRSGDEEPIALGDGQGFGYGTAFIFDPGSGWLLVQNSKHSVSVDDIVLYLHQCRRRPLFQFELHPILRDDEVAKLRKMNRFTALSFTVSGISSSLFHEAKAVLGEAFTDPEAPGAETIHVLVSNSEGLKRDWIDRVWNKLRGVKDAQDGTVRVDESKLVGTMDGVRRQQVVNLLNLQLGGSAKVEIGPERYMTYETRISALREVWGLYKHLIHPPKGAS